MRRSLRSIARHLGRSASTVSREVSRNGGAEHYRAARSDEAAWDRARRPKLCKLACHGLVGVRRRLENGMNQNANSLGEFDLAVAVNEVADVEGVLGTAATALGLAVRSFVELGTKTCRVTKISTADRALAMVQASRRRAASTTMSTAVCSTRFILSASGISCCVRLTMTPATIPALRPRAAHIVSNVADSIS